MADISDVEKALVDVIVALIYPSGTGADSVTGEKVRVFRGWPSPGGLSADLAANIQNISVFSDRKTTRITTRYPRVWKSGARVEPTLSVSLSDGTATFSGTGASGQNAGVLVGGNGYIVGVGETDTASTIAASLAGKIAGGVANGPELSVLGSWISAARVEGSATATQETRRQEQDLSVTLWCSDPATRDSLSSAVDSGLSSIDWLELDDGTQARLQFKDTDVTDSSENIDLYRRDLIFRVEYPTIVQQTVAEMLFGSADFVLNAGATSDNDVELPLVGAIRFDAWYDPADTIDQQCAAALSPPEWNGRLPSNAVIDAGGAASWPLADQATIDFEISAAVRAGLSFWAFDAYNPTDGLSRALSLYLSSSRRSTLQFCMIGQSSAWADSSTSDGYSATFARDISLMSEPGYLQVLGGRPLYFVLDASSAQLAGLSGGIAAAISTIRARVQSAGLSNPYIVWLSGAALADYDNTDAAIAAGADAAGAYATPRFPGMTLSYEILAQTAALDWAQRASKTLACVPTAMSGWDQRPLIQTPQPFYPLAAGLTDVEYYEAGTVQDIGEHVAMMMDFVAAHPAACPANVGLLYAWNELAEGGWIMPTYTASGADVSRVAAIGDALAAARLSISRTLSITS